MTTRILFRFHRNYDVCRQNLRLLRRLNPGVPIDGLYGGRDSNLPAAVLDSLDSCWADPLDPGH